MCRLLRDLSPCLRIFPSKRVGAVKDLMYVQTFINVSTVPVIWNWNNRCILRVFVSQKFYLHELWNLHIYRMCPKASLTNRLWEIRNSSTQSWDIAILRKQDWSIFAQFHGKILKIEQKCFNLSSFKLQYLKIGLMNFGFLKACWSGRLLGTF